MKLDQLYMTEEKTIQAPAQLSKINIRDTAEVEYWMNLFGCSEVALRVAVNAVGVSPRNVGLFLNKYKLGSRSILSDLEALLVA